MIHAITFALLTWMPAPETFINERDSIAEIDVRRSVIRWKGTKMMNTGSHEGTIRFRSGHLQFKGNAIVGGEFVVDMKTIDITDIPLHEPVPRKNLKDHLEQDFDVARYPTASLSITVSSGKRGQQEVCGKLTIKGITRDVCFKTIRKGDKWSAELTVLRDHFGIGEDGSWLEKRLVDQEIKLSVEIRLVHSPRQNPKPTL